MTIIIIYNDNFLFHNAYNINNVMYNTQYKSHCDNFFRRLPYSRYCVLQNSPITQFQIRYRWDTRIALRQRSVYNITRDPYILIHRLLLQSHDVLCISFCHLIHVSVYVYVCAVCFWSHTLVSSLSRNKRIPNLDVRLHMARCFDLGSLLARKREKLDIFFSFNYSFMHAGKCREAPLSQK